MSARAPAALAEAPGGVPSRPRARVHFFGADGWLTGAGGWGLLTSLAVAAAAANTANNLLYLLLGLVIAAYPVSAWMSRRALLRLRADLAAPAEVRAGQAADVIASVGCGSHGAAGVVLELHARDAAGRDAAPSVAAPALEADREATVVLPLALRRRGLARVRLFARSSFPFGLIEGVRRLAEREALVLPQADPSWRTAVPDSIGDGASASVKGEGVDVLNIRDHAWGDDARRIDWKATARLRKPMVRETARDQQRHAVLVVTPAGELSGEAADHAFEKAVSLAAGAAEDLWREGWTLRLLAPGTVVRGDARTILRALALVEPADRVRADWWSQHVLPGETVVELRAETWGASARVRGAG